MTILPFSFFSKFQITFLINKGNAVIIGKAEVMPLVLCFSYQGLQIVLVLWYVANIMVIAKGHAIIFPYILFIEGLK